MKKINNTLEEFLQTIIELVGEGTSDNYAVMVMNNFIEEEEETYPFVEYIDIAPHSVDIGEEINDVDKEEVGEFVTEMMDDLFSELFKHLVRRKMPDDQYEELRSLGVDI